MRIPANSVVHVSALSPAGEQYINFEAASDAGPYLHDGSLIALDRTTVPVSLAQLLGDADGLLAQVDPRKIELIKKELSLSKEGPAKLAAIVDGGTFLLSTLDSVLPQTTSIIKTSRVVLTLASDKNTGLAATATELNQTLAGVARMQAGYRRLTEQTPRTLSAVDNLFADNSDTMVQLLGSMATMSQLLYLRVPALNALFPDYRGSVLDAVTSAFHDHGVWATADLYPRYVCDYGTPSHPPSAADYYEPFMYTYCRDDDPAVSIRGAKNAPRPGGDDTAGPPPGADLGQRTDPTPRGRFTIPTPYGGPAAADRTAALSVESIEPIGDDRGRDYQEERRSRRRTPTPTTEASAKRPTVETGRRSRRRRQPTKPPTDEDEDDEADEGDEPTDEDEGGLLKRKRATTERAQATLAPISASQRAAAVTRCLTCRFGIPRVEAVARASGEAGRPAGPTSRRRLRPGADEHRLEQGRRELQAGARRRDR